MKLITLSLMLLVVGAISIGEARAQVAQPAAPAPPPAPPPAGLVPAAPQPVSMFEVYSQPQTFVVRSPVGLQAQPGYELGDFLYAIDRIRSDVTVQFGGSSAENIGLVSYIRTNLPHAREIQVSTDIRKQKFVRRSFADQMVDRVVKVTGMLGALLDSNGLHVTVTIESQPTEAVFEICSYESRCLQRPTQSGTFSALYTQPTNFVIRNFRRGLYWYRVTRTGFKPIDGVLDLVDFDAQKLNCALVAEKAAELVKPCKMVP